MATDEEVNSEKTWTWMFISHHQTTGQIHYTSKMSVIINNLRMRSSDIWGWWEQIKIPFMRKLRAEKFRKC
jgi:hypothetical protein